MANKYTQLMNQHTVSVVRNGKYLRYSKNLRGMLDYARVSPVRRVELTPQGVKAGRVRVIYSDGATCAANFESYVVAHDFIRARRSWHGAEVVIY